MTLIFLNALLFITSMDACNNNNNKESKRKKVTRVKNYDKKKK